MTSSQRFWPTSAITIVPSGGRRRSARDCAGRSPATRPRGSTRIDPQQLAEPRGRVLRVVERVAAAAAVAGRRPQLAVRPNCSCPPLWLLAGAGSTAAGGRSWGRRRSGWPASGGTRGPRCRPWVAATRSGTRRSARTSRSRRANAIDSSRARSRRTVIEQVQERRRLQHAVDDQPHPPRLLDHEHPVRVAHRRARVGRRGERPNGAAPARRAAGAASARASSTARARRPRRSASHTHPAGDRVRTLPAAVDEPATAAPPQRPLAPQRAPDRPQPARRQPQPHDVRRPAASSRARSGTTPRP